MKQLSIIFTVIFVSFAAYGSSMKTLIETAQNKEIQHDAALIAKHTIKITAPVHVVWKHLSDVQNWPDWNKEISEVKIENSVKPDTTFIWKSGTTIKSTFRVVDDPNYLIWTGKVLWTKAIHIWELKPLSEDETMVTVRESMDGFLITMLYSQEKLDSLLNNWLSNLKSVSEK